MSYAIKAAIDALQEAELSFRGQKTMYGGKRISRGDTVYLFASENEGGRGLAARGVVAEAAAVPRRPGVARQTPLVDLRIAVTARARA